VGAVEGSMAEEVWAGGGVKRGRSIDPQVFADSSRIGDILGFQRQQVDEDGDQGIPYIFRVPLDCSEIKGTARQAKDNLASRFL